MQYPWKHSRRFNSYPEYLKKLFGNRIQKVTIDGGFTCPNRDGTVGYGGCTYCNNDAFNPHYCHPAKSITQQINEGIAFHARRYRKADKFLAYFQAYSSTHAPLNKLKQLFTEAINHPAVTGIVVGTRPDCIDDEKLNFFAEINSSYFVSIEYGVESCYDRSLQATNRGHTFAQSRLAIETTAKLGIHTGAHLILGLPGETYEDWMEEAKIISQLSLNSLKIHQLQIFRNTRMEELFNQSPEEFHLFTLEDYLDILVNFLEYLNPEIAIERFTSEAPPRFLAHAPWGKIRNNQVLAMLEKRLEERQTWQGRLFK